MKLVNTLCPICLEGNLHNKVGKNPVEHDGYKTELDFYYSVCDVCGSEQADANQSEINKNVMIDFKS